MTKFHVSVHELGRHINRQIGPSDWVKVSQEKIDLYAQAANDFNWIHVDVRRASAVFGGTIAHGLLTLSLAPPLAQELIEIDGIETDLNYGFQRVRFPSVVHGGDRVRLSLKILGVEPRGQGVLLRMEYRMDIEGRDKPAVVADWTFMLFPSPEALSRQADNSGHSSVG